MEEERIEFYPLNFVFFDGCDDRLGDGFDTGLGVDFSARDRFGAVRVDLLDNLDGFGSCLFLRKNGGFNIRDFRPSRCSSSSGAVAAIANGEDDSKNTDGQEKQGGNDADGTKCRVACRVIVVIPAVRAVDVVTSSQEEGGEGKRNHRSDEREHSGYDCDHHV